MNLSDIYKIFMQSSGISIDTRTLKKNNLFFAISGDRFNGNTFAEEAIKKRALKVIIDDPSYYTENTILVEDSLKTLQLLANLHRRKLKLPILALTGSNGKTTTKELFNCVLSTKFNTSATIGNLNNHLGVPLTLLQMNKNTEFGIVEMGANHLKEIEELCQIAEPDYGYITNFGKAHLEGFGGVEGIIKGKSELYQYLKANNKKAFINLDDSKQTKQATGIEQFTFSETKASHTQIQFTNNIPFVSIQYKNLPINSNLIGKYNFSNIAAAIAVGEYFNIDPKDIKTAIENYTPTNNRSQIIKKKNNQIILDAYNANPTSMLAALENLSSLATPKKTVFLGDMFELGKTSLEEHQIITDYLIQSDFEHIILVGEIFLQTNYPSSIAVYKDFEELKNKYQIQLKNQTILIKGSRGMALERILDIL